MLQLISFVGQADRLPHGVPNLSTLTDQTFSNPEQTHRSRGPAAAIDELIQTFEARKEYHRLFDALLLKKKFEMGLPLARPSSFENVPDARQSEFESAYVDAARRAGAVTHFSLERPTLTDLFRKAVAA